jgi:hypothetical protein
MDTGVIHGLTVMKQGVLRERVRGRANSNVWIG